MLKKIEKIIRESAFDKKKKKSGLKFNPGLALTCVRTTGPRCFPCDFYYNISNVILMFMNFEAWSLNISADNKLNIAWQ